MARLPGDNERELSPFLADTPLLAEAEVEASPEALLGYIVPEPTALPSVCDDVSLGLFLLRRFLCGLVLVLPGCSSPAKLLVVAVGSSLPESPSSPADDEERSACSRVRIRLTGTETETGVCTVDRAAVGVTDELGRDTEMEGGARPRAKSDGALAGGGDLAGDDRLAGLKWGIGLG